MLLIHFIAMPQSLPSRVLREQFGEIDIYLFDQLLRGRFDHRRRVLDAGCGDGRNLTYFLRSGFTCFALDADPFAIARVRTLAASLGPDLPEDNFQVGDLAHLPWADATMDAVISSAVLHFVDDEAEFGACMAEMWRVLAPDGLFFGRLASNIGLEAQVGRARRRVTIPDGSDRFVVDEAMLREWTDRLGGRLADPIKTTNVEQQRAMTTWCAVKA
jgi:tellurite methyltransferase